ncbi:hypothetical protein FPQ18DRAFT_239724, partial [Pyronema domesticum]
YLWDDTCCINKSVVGEHQESLAMMGDWYTNAEFCITYLGTETSCFKSIKNPWWSTRGWTLQELVLSRKAHFYNNKWELLQPDAGISKADIDEAIAKFSRIPIEEVCRGGSSSTLHGFDIMHLMSRRQLTVPTDQAYALMGMLGVKFQAFHAEGISMALSRLICEYVIATNDVSVFNWFG